MQPLTLSYRLASRFIFVLAIVYSSLANAQNPGHLSRTLPVSGPVTLDVAMVKGEITILQGRDDRMVITAWFQPGKTQPAAPPARLPLTVDQDGNHIHLGYINDSAAANPVAEMRIAVRIEAPLKSGIISSIENGNLTIVGIDGPVEAQSTRGNISISYVMKEVSARSGSGNLNFEAVSGRVSGIASNGNISCIRIPAGVTAETGEGDITLQVVGPSEARVRRGGGRIEVGGARGTITATTDTGDLHVKAIPHQDWQLTSGSGNIHLELPPATGFEIDALTRAGNITVRHEDIRDAAGGKLTQAVDGGGRTIRVRTQNGNIVLD